MKLFILLAFITFNVQAISLTWDASISTDVGGYKIYYGSASGQYNHINDVGNTLTHTLSAPLPFYASVSAYSNSKYWQETSITGVTQWPLNLPELIAPAIGYKIYWGTSPGIYTNTQDIGSSTNYIITGLNSAITYYLNASTYSVVGDILPESGYSNEVSIIDNAPIAGLVAAYGFDELNGSAVTDSSGNSNAGTIFEATRIPTGKYGKALQFDGVNDWVTVNDSASLDLSTGMTLEAWVYPQSLTSGWDNVILKEAVGHDVYSLYSNNNNHVPVSAFDNGSIRILPGPNQLPVNQWTHLVSTYDGQYLRLYVNGKEVANSAQNGLIQQSSGVLRIGGNSIWGEFSQCYIDEVRIYNKALTTTEINYDMNHAINLPIIPPPTGLHLVQ